MLNILSNSNLVMKYKREFVIGIMFVSDKVKILKRENRWKIFNILERYCKNTKNLKFELLR